MAADIAPIRPVTQFTVRRVASKRDHEGKKDYPHEDADRFAEELSDTLEHEEREGHAGQPPDDEPQLQEQDEAAETESVSLPEEQQSLAPPRDEEDALQSHSDGSHINVVTVDAYVEASEDAPPEDEVQHIDFEA